MGGSASYRLAKKIARAIQDGAPQSEIDELERRRQEAREAERQKRLAAKQPPAEKTFKDRINDTQTKEEFASVMRERYGNKAVSDDFINRTELSMAKRVMGVISDLEARYPFMEGFIKKFDIRNDAIAAMRQDGTLTLNPVFWEMKDNPVLYESSYNTPNSTPEATIAHEFGHAIHNYYFNWMREGNLTFLELSKLYKKRLSGEFLNDVWKLAKKKAHVKSKDALLSGISRYAKTNVMEGFAEAFADVYSNGDNASNNSKAYVEAMFETLESQYGIKA